MNDDTAGPRRFVASAFALGMVPARCRLVVEPVDAVEVRDALCGFCPACDGDGCPGCNGAGHVNAATSAVGHASTAEAYSALLGVPVACNRRVLALDVGDVVYVGALVALDGAPWRPPEGVVLDRAALNAVRVEWRRVEVAGE